MEEYLTTKELSTRIKLSPQTIYNKKCQGEFEFRKHFLQPSRKKTLWIWSAMKEWLEQSYSKDVRTIDDKATNSLRGSQSKNKVTKAEGNNSSTQTSIQTNSINI